MRRNAKVWVWIAAVFPAALLAQGRYETWSLGIPQDDRGFASDPDLDFYENGLEFVLGDHPLEGATAIEPEIGQISDGLDQFATLTFVASDSSFVDVVVSVEASGDASSWAPVASLVPRSTWKGPGRVTAEPLAGSSRTRIVVRDPVAFSPQQPRFLRLVVTLRRDRDADGLTDQYEEENGLNPDIPDADLDQDGDGLANLVEHDLNTRANRRDSDGDGTCDGLEHATGQDPSAPATGTNTHLVTKLIVHLPTR